MFSAQQAKEFEDIANPHSWFLVASELSEQASLIKDSGSTTITRHDRVSKVESSWPASNRAVMLLSGFALENILKAYLVYETPAFVKNGFLGRMLHSHKLTKLAQLSACIPYKSRGMNTLAYFEDGLESWARYPCGLNWAQSKDQTVLSDRMWRNYRWLMSAYEKRFKALVSNGWEGPHEFQGSFEIKGDWL